MRKMTFCWISQNGRSWCGRVAPSFLIFFVTVTGPSLSHCRELVVRVRLMKGLVHWQVTNIQPQREFIQLGVALDKEGPVRALRAVDIIRDQKWLAEAKAGLPLIAAHPGSMRLNGRSLPDHVKIFFMPSGQWDVVVEMDLEQYLLGVLPNEVPATWPMEVLKAQAVVARTFTLYRMGQKRFHHYDLDASTKDQVYRQPSLIPADKRQDLLKRVQEALDSTQQQILLWKETRQIFPAFYHASCGGMTERPSVVWGGEKLDWPIRRDSFCEFRRQRKWEVQFTQAELVKIFGCQNPKRMTLKVVDYSKSQRVNWIEIRCGRIRQKISGQAFRSKLGETRVRSTRFELREQSGVWNIVGQGVGHGVGMCQDGAYHRARYGSSYRNILSHYFPKAVISNTVPVGTYARNTRSAKNIKTTTDNKL